MVFNTTGNKIALSSGKKPVCCFWYQRFNVKHPLQVLFYITWCYEYCLKKKNTSPNRLKWMMRFIFTFAILIEHHNKLYSRYSMVWIAATLAKWEPTRLFTEVTNTAVLSWKLIPVQTVPKGKARMTFFYCQKVSLKKTKKYICTSILFMYSNLSVTQSFLLKS